MDEGAYRRGRDPETSVEAAATVDVGRYSTIILQHLQRVYPRGLTIDQLEAITGVSRQTLSPRMAELLRKSRIHRKLLGMRGAHYVYETRPGNKSRGMIVWYYGPAPSANGQLSLPVEPPKPTPPPMKPVRMSEELVLVALRAWVERQSEPNARNLYNAALSHFEIIPEYT